MLLSVAISALGEKKTIRGMNTNRLLLLEWSGGLGAGLHAQDVPGDIRTQVFATDVPGGGSLDSRAPLGGHATSAGFPLAEQRCRDVQLFCEPCLPARLTCDPVVECVHESIVSAALKSVNSATRIDLRSAALKNRSMRIDEIYRARLRLLIKEAGSQTKLAATIGKSPAQISQWLNASKDSRTGKPRSMDRNTARIIEAACKKPDGWMDQPLEDKTLAGGEFLAVRHVDVRFSNGAGQVVDREDDKPPLVFRTDFLRRMGIAAGNAVVVDADGISNEPKIVDGSVVLVNRGDTERLDGDFFAFRSDGELLIKRLNDLPNVGVLATAENPNFKPKTKVYTQSEVESGGFEVIGRAVWVGAML